MRGLVPSLTILVCTACSRAPADGAPAPSLADPPPSHRTLAHSPPRALYSLPDDLHTLTDRIHTSLGPTLPLFVQDDVFLFLAPDHGPLLSPAARNAHRSLDAFFNGRHFDTRPEQAVRVYVFSTPDAYSAFCTDHLGAPCETPYGFYRRGAREILVDAATGPGTISHELLHPIAEHDFEVHASGGHIPRWFDEGLGALFEQPRFTSDGDIVGEKNWRHAGLLAALRSPTDAPHVRMSALFGMSDDAFLGKLEDGGTDATLLALHYAAARYLCQWLQDRKPRGEELWTLYREWRDHFADDPSGRRTFERVEGRTPEQAESDWEHWVGGL